MRKTRFIQMVVLVCIGSLAACSSGEDGTVGNTELNVIVPNGGPGTGGGSSAPGLIDIQEVEYTINCEGTPQTFLDNNTPLPNDGAVQVNGTLEVVDGRTNRTCGGTNGGTACETNADCTAGACLPVEPDFGFNPGGPQPLPDGRAEVWQGFMDLPIGPCTVQLRARDGDGEVICSATEGVEILPSTTTKVNLLMICDTSFQAPVGMLDVDATFSFVVGNFCPDLFVLNCVDSTPAEADIGLPVPIATTDCEVRSRDVDEQCGQSCDPQVCTETPEGLDCAPDPAFLNPGVTTTVTCTDLWIDCNGDLGLSQSTGAPCATDADCDASNNELCNPLTGACFVNACTFAGDLTGSVGGGSDPSANGNFRAICIPAAAGGTPGVEGQCTAVTTDGDEDCNKTKQLSLPIDCPGLNFCDEPSTDCDDGNSCTANDCDRSAQACDNSFLAAGTPCVTGGFGGQCDGAGTCVSQDCNAQPDPIDFCDDGSVCTGSVCNADGSCSNPPTNEGGSCDSGTGSGDGSCSSGSCASNDECTAGDTSGCPAAPECFDATCDTGGAPFLCDTAPSAAGTPCTSVPNGACDGAGVCAAPPVIDPGSGSTTWEANTDLGGGNGTADGCTVFVDTISNDIFLDVFITLIATSDGSNNMSTEWVINALNSLLPVLQNAAEYGGINIDAVVSGANGGPIVSGAGPNAGLLLSNYLSGTTLILESPDEITVGNAALTPTGGTVNVNWSGNFTLDLTLGGAPLVTVDESVCVFDNPGTGVDFPVN